jgi:hypothetical protein
VLGFCLGPPAGPLSKQLKGMVLLALRKNGRLMICFNGREMIKTSLRMALS